MSVATISLVIARSNLLPLAPLGPVESHAPKRRADGACRYKAVAFRVDARVTPCPMGPYRKRTPPDCSAAGGVGARRLRLERAADLLGPGAICPPSPSRESRMIAS